MSGWREEKKGVREPRRSGGRRNCSWDVFYERRIFFKKIRITGHCPRNTTGWVICLTEKHITCGAEFMSQATQERAVHRFVVEWKIEAILSP